MIVGECPYSDCELPLLCDSPEKMPAWERHVCAACQRVIWTYRSRVNPYSLTEEEFNLECRVILDGEAVSSRAHDSDMEDR